MEEATLTCLRAILAAPGLSRTYPPEFELGFACLEMWECKERWQVLVPACTSEKLTKQRRQLLESLLAKCEDRTVLEAHAKWTSTLGAKAAERRAAAEALLENVEKSCVKAEALKAQRADDRAAKKKQAT